jgi:hypothetical protein
LGTRLYTLKNDMSDRNAEKDEGSESDAVVNWLDEVFGKEEDQSDDPSRKRDRFDSDSPVEVQTSRSEPKRQRKPTATVISALGSGGGMPSSMSMVSSAGEPFGMQSNDVSASLRAEGAIIMPPQIAGEYHAVSARQQANGFKRPDRKLVSAQPPSAVTSRGRCKLCFYALSGALSVNKGGAEDGKEAGIEFNTQKVHRKSAGECIPVDKPSGWEYHNGVAILSAIWKMYKSADMFAGKDELCAAIARQWNAYISPTLKERYGSKRGRRARGGPQSKRDKTSTGNMSHLGEMLIESLKSAAEERRRGKAVRQSKRSVGSAIFDDDESIDSESDDGLSTPRRPMYEDEQSDEDEEYYSSCDDENECGESMMLSVDDVLWHFENCSKTAADELDTDIDMLNKIGTHLVENEMFVVAEDTVLDEDGDGNTSVVQNADSQRVIINDRALHMYLSVLNTKRQHADSMLRQKKEDGVPSAYTLLAMRREIDGDSKDNGIGVRNMQRLDVKGKLTGV